MESCDKWGVVFRGWTDGGGWFTRKPEEALGDEAAVLEVEALILELQPALLLCDRCYTNLKTKTASIAEHF